MECTGKIKDVSIDWQTKQINLSLSINEKNSITEIEKLNEWLNDEESKKRNEDRKLSIKIVKYREKRSLNANAYFHVLVGKIAEAKTISKARAKNELIARYGQPELLEDGEPLIYKTNAPVEYMQELETIHSIPVKFTEENGKEVVFYKLYRGSHTYNTYEMSKLIDGTVADAKEYDIETLTPDELKRMMEQYEKHNSN